MRTGLWPCRTRAGQIGCRLEQRIAELEVELAAKGEQNLDLIKAKIETTRKQLEGERSQERLDWN
jgi:uncharacterized coiled-coil protein SlyX